MNWKCPDCGSEDTANGSNDTLHCLNCGAVNDRFVMRYNREKYGEYKL